MSYVSSTVIWKVWQRKERCRASSNQSVDCITHTSHFKGLKDKFITMKKINFWRASLSNLIMFESTCESCFSTRLHEDQWWNGMCWFNWVEVINGYYLSAETGLPQLARSKTSVWREKHCRWVAEERYPSRPQTWAKSACSTRSYEPCWTWSVLGRSQWPPRCDHPHLLWWRWGGRCPGDAQGPKAAWRTVGTSHSHKP